MFALAILALMFPGYYLAYDSSRLSGSASYQHQISKKGYVSTMGDLSMSYDEIIFGFGRFQSDSDDDETDSSETWLNLGYQFSNSFNLNIEASRLNETGGVVGKQGKLAMYWALGSIVEDALTVLRLEGGGARYESRDTDIGATFDETKTDFKQYFWQANLEQDLGPYITIGYSYKEYGYKDDSSTTSAGLISPTKGIASYTLEEHLAFLSLYPIDWMDLGYSYSYIQADSTDPTKSHDVSASFLIANRLKWGLNYTYSKAEVSQNYYATSISLFF